MSMPKVSVLVPAYNHEKYLSETIESVLNQTFEDFELLISDDCSTDNSVEVIERYKDERIRAFYFDKNQGTVRALNYLLKEAKGEYIAVLGSDDVWESDKLEKQLEILESDSSLGACFTWAKIIDQNSDVVDNNINFNKDIFNVTNCDKSEWLRQIFQRGNHFCHSSVLIRSDIHREIGEYNIAYRQLHDMDLWIRILLNYNVYMIEMPLVRYRFVINSNNVSKNNEKNNLRLINEAEEILDYMFENIRDVDFKQGFGELFIHKNAESATEILCEKIMLIHREGLWGRNNSSLAMRYLLRHFSLEVLQCFEEKYERGLNDLYDLTAEYKASSDANVYQVLKELQEERVSLMSRCHELALHVNALQEQIQEIYSSSSWKITKPLRSLMKIIK